jgi:hypothetical protein
MKIGSHPLGQGVSRATPTADLGWFNHPHAQRDGPATPKGQKKKKEKKKKKVLGFWGWPTTPKGLGVAEATPKPLEVVRPPPKIQNPFFVFFFFFFFFCGPFGGGRTTPLGLGVVRPPQTGRGGDSSHPRFSYVSFLLFFFFQFSSLFFKKKKKINGQTMSFWAGWVL